MTHAPAANPNHEATDECRHHWVIDTPNGAISTGLCKRCGERREFRNSAEDRQWDSDSFSLGPRGRKRAS